MAPMRTGPRALERLAGSSTGLGQVFMARFFRVDLMAPVAGVTIIKSRVVWHRTVHLITEAAKGAMLQSQGWGGFYSLTHFTGCWGLEGQY